MKKLRIGILLVLTCLFVTACSCSKKTKEYTVTFDSNGGSVVASQTVKEGGKVKEPTDPTRDGYTFAGWYLSLSDKEEYDFDTEVTKSFTLYAKWSGTGENVCKLTCEEGYELVNADSADCSCKKIDLSVTGVSLNRSEITLIVGETFTVTATVRPSNATDKNLTWTTSNSGIATVSGGRITAISEGTAYITVTVGGKTATVTVYVITQDRANMNAALNSVVGKTIERGNEVNINDYSSNGCAISITSYNGVPEGSQMDNNYLVTKVYRALGESRVNATYQITCGGLSESKSVDHIIPASTYTYTKYEEFMPVIHVNGAENYSLVKHGSNIVARYGDNHGQNGGAYAMDYEPGAVYDMTFDGHDETVYAVSEAN